MKPSAPLTGLASLILSTKTCCVVGYWLAGSFGLVGLGLSHFFLESVFRSIAIAGFLVSTYQTARNVWRVYHCRNANWRIAQLHTAIVMIVLVVGVPRLFHPTKTVHINDPMCGPQGATVRR